MNLKKEAFQVVILGCTGGPRETNLSGYLLSPIEKEEWIVLDAGSLLGGIDLAIERKTLPHPLHDHQLTPAGEMLAHHIKSYLISHAHLDHISGLVLNSQCDETKSILGIDPTINNLRDHIFNGRIWPNYGSEGVEPILKKYHYLRLPLHKPTPIPSTGMVTEAFLLSHPQGYPSTAFLIENNKEYILYFGDTSSDFLEVEKHLARVWRRIAPLWREGKFHGMFLECSYPQKSSEVIFGHLDPKLLMKELHHFSEIAGSSLEGLNVIITHRKESLKRGPDTKDVIKEEILSLNDLKINFIFPTQGDRYTL